MNVQKTCSLFVVVVASLALARPSQDIAADGSGPIPAPPGYQLADGSGPIPPPPGYQLADGSGPIPPPPGYQLADVLKLVAV